MKKSRVYYSQIILVLMLLATGTSNGQEMLGVAFSNYSGVSSAAINPAFLTGTRVFMDINLFSGNFSFANNAFYFEPGNRTIRKVLNSDTTAFNSGRFNWGRSYNYYNNTHDKYITSNVKIVGPSIMIQAGDHAFGLTTAFRSMHSGNHIPYGIPITAYEGISYEPYHGTEFNNSNYDFISMTWSELGLSYAYNFYNFYSNRLTFGITAKALLGYEGAYLNMHNANYVIENDRDVNFINVDADIGFALPVGYGDEFEYDLAPLVKGYGAGFDIGFVYTKLKSTVVYERDDKLCARPYNDYKYKIGFSILDIGVISFTENAELHEFNNVSKDWKEFDTIHFKGIDYALSVYSEVFYGDPEASQTGNKISIGLPATLSFQFDYHLKQRIYISALWMHPLRINSRTIWRPAQLAVIPRYENRYFGISVPFSLFNYTDPRLGLAIRVYSMTIGTDRFGSLLGISNLNGMDIYFSFRFNIGKGACASYTRGACKNQNFGNDW